MSDDEEYYDDDFDWADELYDLAVISSQPSSCLFPKTSQGDLAGNVVPSPTWVSYPPDYDSVSYESDWDYYSDGYYDEVPPKDNKRKAIGSGEAKIERETAGELGNLKKRRKLKSTNESDISSHELLLSNPTVIWRSTKERLQPLEIPLVREGQGEKVALLKDWRERFELSSSSSLPADTYPEPPAPDPSVSKQPEHKGSQRVIVVPLNGGSFQDPEETTALDEDTAILPPTSLTPEQMMPSRRKLPSQHSIAATNNSSKKRKASTLADEHQHFIDSPPSTTKSGLPAEKKAGKPQGADMADLPNGNTQRRGKRKAQQQEEEAEEEMVANDISPRTLKQKPLANGKSTRASTRKKRE